MEDLIKKADIYIEFGNKLKEFSKKEYANKKESELTEDELKEFREFLGYIFLTMKKIKS